VSRSGPGAIPVRELLRDRCRFELGSAEQVQGSHVAVLAHWSARPTVSRSVRTLVQELQAYGYQVVVSSTCESTDALAWGPDVSVDDLVVIRRPNVGYDFGSWSIGLDLVPAAVTADRTILLNDSMAGPFTSLRPLLDAFDATPADVWGLTDTQQLGSHLQSYFLGFRDQVLAERALARFWAEVRHEAHKSHVIVRNEIGLSRLLQVEGFVHVPAFSHERVVSHGENPVIRGWKRLLELGFPFLKREILRDPAVAPGGRSAPAVLRRRFGIEVADWVDEELAA
jgi:lipopolysaccharide biosynthesis protein